MDRIKLLRDLSSQIMKIDRARPFKIAIDGITASGKTTLADELARSLNSLGAKVHRASLDGFHNPKSIRHSRGRNSPEGYYFDAYNYNAIAKHLLKPLDTDEDPKYRTQVLNLESDEESYSDQIKIEKDAVLIVDGSFSLRKELYEFWDFSIYLYVKMKNAQQRAGARDQKLFNSKELAIETTRDRYHAAHLIHNELEKPWRKASVVIDNNQPKKAFLLDNANLNLY